MNYALKKRGPESILVGSVDVDDKTGKIVSFEGVDANHLIGAQPYGEFSQRSFDENGKSVFDVLSLPSNPIEHQHYDFHLDRLLRPLGLETKRP